jgi:hypothetical protein
MVGSIERMTEGGPLSIALAFEVINGNLTLSQAEKVMSLLAYQAVPDTIGETIGDLTQAIEIAKAERKWGFSERS